MKHTISVIRDILDDQGVLRAQETESLELDSQVDPVEVWDHFMSIGAFAGPGLTQPTEPASGNG